MTAPLLALERASHVLPDGRILFSDLDLRLDDRPTGLVGRNGAGKSVLARILAGELRPTTGRRTGSARVHYLPQQIAIGPDDTVATLARVRPALDALARIEAGSVDAHDFELLADRWELRSQLAAELARQDLRGVPFDRPAHTLSGGQAMRVALAGAWLSGADMLILDEPTNHLDAAQRQRLREQLAGWTRGLLVISHDRPLLDRMQRIEELSSLGLRSYGGGHAFYAARKAEERAQSERVLDQHRTALRRHERERHEQHERQQRRQAHGDRDARQANQAPILLGLARDRSQDSAGRRARQQQAAQVKLVQEVREAAAAIETSTDLAMFAPPATAVADRIIARLEQVVLPHVPATGEGIDLIITGRQRIALHGPNGSGKTTLLRVLAGQTAPLHGRCELRTPVAWLDQRLASLEPDRSAAAQLREANPTAGEGALRTRLALLGLDAARVELPSARLSGGERLKAALALALYREQPAGLLLLDEPGNHLDLDSLHALERMLLQYSGAWVIASHDDALLKAIAPTHRLDVSASPWRLAPW